MRGANVVRRRSGTNPGEAVGATGAVNGGQADGGGSGLLAGAAAAGDGPGVPASAGPDAELRSNPSSPQWTSPGRQAAPGGKGGGHASSSSAPSASPEAPPDAPPPASLVRATPHPKRPGSSRSRFALVNWRVRWRLAAVIAIPTLTAAVLGALAINTDVNTWQATGRVQHLAQLNSAVVKYIYALEDERDYSAASTANGAGYSSKLRTARQVTDGTAAEVAALANGITVGDGYQPVAVQELNAVLVSIKVLPAIRHAVSTPDFPMVAIMWVYTVNIIRPANTV